MGQSPTPLHARPELQLDFPGESRFWNFWLNLEEERKNEVVLRAQHHLRGMGFNEDHAFIRSSLEELKAKIGDAFFLGRFSWELLNEDQRKELKKKFFMALGMHSTAVSLDLEEGTIWRAYHWPDVAVALHISLVSLIAEGSFESDDEKQQLQDIPFNDMMASVKEFMTMQYERMVDEKWAKSAQLMRTQLGLMRREMPRLPQEAPGVDPILTSQVPFIRDMLMLFSAEKLSHENLMAMTAFLRFKEIEDENVRVQVGIALREVYVNADSTLQTNLSYGGRTTLMNLDETAMGNTDVFDEAIDELKQLTKFQLMRAFRRAYADVAGHT